MTLITAIGVPSIGSHKDVAVVVENKMETVSNIGVALECTCGLTTSYPFQQEIRIIKLVSSPQ